MGWCALDRRRRPLTGAELRGCWVERPSSAVTATATVSRAPVAPSATWRDLPVRDFVPVDSLPPDPGSAELPVPLPVDLPLLAVDPPDAWDGRVSLFGEAER